MKLAEALSIRKDLQKRIQQIGKRLEDNVKFKRVMSQLKTPMN